MSRFRNPTAALVALVLGISVLLTGAPRAAAESIAETPAPSTLNLANKQEIVALFDYVNTFRADKGLQPLTFNVTVSEMAEDWSDTMAAQNSMVHNPHYATDERVVDRWTAAGENVAWSSQPYGEAIGFLWEMSPSHNLNMSRPEITTMGLGLTVTGDCSGNVPGCRMWATQNLFDFHTPPPGTYRTAQDYFDGQPSLDASSPVVVRAAVPTVNDETGQYTVPASDGVDYYVGNALTPAGTYRAKTPRIIVRAEARPGYKLLGKTSWWLEFHKPLKVIAAPVIFVDKDGTADDSFTIPSVNGVEYVVRGAALSAKTYSGTGTVTATARAMNGYALTLGTADTWSHTFSAAPLSATPAPVVFTDKPGTANDTYTIPAAVGINYQVGGKSRTPGTYPGAGTVTVTAKAAAGYVISPGGTTTWTATFSEDRTSYTPPAVSPFADVSTGQLFYKEMAWLADQGISTGWAESNGTRTYRPMQSINRDAMAAFLYRTAGSPPYNAPAKSPFADVSTGQQFYKEMSWLAEQGISTGWTEPNGTRTYRPMQSINRDAMAAFLYRYKDRMQ